MRFSIYRQKAIDLINNRGEGIEIYYQPAIGKENMVIYNSASNELVVGNVNGEIQTLFKPRPGYTDDLVKQGRAIKIKG